MLGKFARLRGPVQRLNNAAAKQMPAMVHVPSANFGKYFKELFLTFINYRKGN